MGYCILLRLAHWLLPSGHYYRYLTITITIIVFYPTPTHIHSLSSWKSPGEGGACVMRSRDKIRSYKVPTTGSNMMFIIRCRLCFSDCGRILRGGEMFFFWVF